MCTERFPLILARKIKPSLLSRRENGTQESLGGKDKGEGDPVGQRRAFFVVVVEVFETQSPWQGQVLLLVKRTSFPCPQMPHISSRHL